MAVRSRINITYTSEHAISWQCEGEDFLHRSSHALVVDGKVWLVDPIEAPGIDSELRDLGEIAGVIVLLDRHLRDGARLASRHEVPLWVPRGHRKLELKADVRDYDLTIPGTPFVVLEVQQIDHVWVERALWWPEPKLLVVADCVGNADYFQTLRDEPLAVHPLLRLTPPRQLRNVHPQVVLTGHGDPVTHDADRSLQFALDESRRELPAYAVRAPLHGLRFMRMLAGSRKTRC